MRRTALCGLLLLLSSCRRSDPWAATVFQEKRIYNACFAFASVNGHLPATLDELVPDFLQDRHALGDPDHSDAGEIGYYYYGSGSSGTEPPTAVFLASKVQHQGRRALLRFSGDGSISTFRPPRS